MKKRAWFFIFLTISLLPLSFYGCKIKRVPSLSTSVITEIGATTAIGGGEVTSDGNADIAVRGICWDTRKSPDFSNSRTTDGYGPGSFTSSMTGLTPKTLYYVRAYATNSEGVGYGNTVTFTTNEYAVPTLTTTAITSITQTTAVSGGNISNNGGVEVTARGVCWSLTTAPVVTGSHSTDGAGNGQFASNITGLTGNTKYYVRAYATNTEGTGYGQEIQFTTSPLLPTVTTSTPSATSTTTGSGGGTASSDGGAPITARGICWSTTANPTILNSRTTDGTGTGTFTSVLTGLNSNTTYHVRAYATNSVGTAYGTDRTFITDPLTITDNDGNVYDVIRIGTQVWTKQNLRTSTLNDGTAIALTTGSAAWSGLTTPGYCWYNGNQSNIYGALYNWFAVNTGKLCPAGWRVSLYDDWIPMENYLGGSTPAGGKLKETGTTHWTTPNTGATNEYDFTAVPGGWRTNTGTYQGIGTNAYWWTSTEYILPDVYYKSIQYDNDKVFTSFTNEKNGLSVRCIKN